MGDGHRGKVLLFHDTFMDYNVPDIGIATTELLERAGFRVELTDTVCCGRAMISKTFIDRAEEQARINVGRLYEHAKEGVFIVGCEPSCLLTLRDEYPKIINDPELKAQSEVVAGQTLLIDEFLVMLQDKGELELAFDENRSSNRQIVFHGHCQQKALADATKSTRLLELAGYNVEFINAVCCGMAGTFGYEKEHYAASSAAGERDVFPAVRARPDADVVVMGISCRHQIEHFTGRSSRHLTQALRDAMTQQAEDARERTAHAST
jgi:Fe-S oxidoreductase